MKSQVATYISHHSMLQKSGKYIVALSGGADSVALACVLLELGYDIEAAHCNFHLRGDESNRDEAFVKRLCREKGIPLHLVHFDTREYAALHKLSIETAARNLRYSYFDNLRRDIHADGICVAHHRDDSVETVLMNLTRGTGINGLTGIKPVNGNIIRPLLCVGRKEIEDYLKSLGQDYVTDSTNLHADEARRNKFRLEVIPLLRQVNPSVSENIQATAQRLVEAQRMADYACSLLIKELISDENGAKTINIGKLKVSPSSEYILYKVLVEYGFSPSQIESIAHNLDKSTGKTITSATHELLFDRGFIIIAPIEEATNPMRIPEPGTYILPTGDKLSVSTVNATKPIEISRDPNIATLDAANIVFPLTVRPAAPFDRFCPFGMKGSKLVSDYLTDRKKSVIAKRKQLVVTTADNTILWLIGERTDNRFRITPATTTVTTLAIAQHLGITS